MHAMNTCFGKSKISQSACRFKSTVVFSVCRWKIGQWCLHACRNYSLLITYSYINYLFMIWKKGHVWFFVYSIHIWKLKDMVLSINENQAHWSCKLNQKPLVTNVLVKSTSVNSS